VKGNERCEEVVIGLFIGNKVGRSHQTFGVSGVVGNVALLVSHSHNVRMRECTPRTPPTFRGSS